MYIKCKAKKGFKHQGIELKTCVRNVGNDTIPATEYIPAIAMQGNRTFPVARCISVIQM